MGPLERIHLSKVRGRKRQIRDRTYEELALLFPRLTPDNYKDVSKATRRYNCVGFAVGDERNWWEFGIYGGGIYWPDGLDYSLSSWIRIFTDLGFERTDDRSIEPGIEKIAIYVNLEDFSPSHAAKSDGTIWKSKLGGYQDIDHDSLEVLEGEEYAYGIVECVLRRPLGQEV